MIEHIQGAGLSGMTGKSTKHGKSSLFAKLLAMLEKNAELSGKGKGLQHNAGKSGKATGLASLTEKSDPFTVAKNKHLLALAAKGKTDGKDKVEDGSTASLLAAHVIVDPKSYVKEFNKADKTSILIAGQISEKAAAQGGELLGKNTAKAAAGLAAGAEAGVLNKGSDKADVLLNQMAQAGAGKESDDLIAQQKGKLAQQTQAMSNESSASDEAALEATSKHGLSSLAKGTQPGDAGLASKGAINAAQETDSKVKLDALARSVLDEQKTIGKLQGNHSLGEKKVASAAAESVHSASAAAALFQQTKVTQPQQAQPQATASLATAGSLGSTEASLADSGSQFSDNRGGQDGRSLNAAMVDAKSSGSLTSTSTNFQNYLTNKSTPVLSPFDSMNFIAQSAKNGQTRLEIQLDPVNLGKIHISLQSDASKQLQVHMIVDQGMTRAALEQQLPQLKSALAQQGFDLSGFSMDSQGQQASSGGEGGSRKSQHFTSNTETVTADAAIAQPQQQMATGSGLSIRV